jgi:hypothetical protein
MYQVAVGRLRVHRPEKSSAGMLNRDWDIVAMFPSKSLDVSAETSWVTILDVSTEARERACEVKVKGCPLNHWGQLGNKLA